MLSLFDVGLNDFLDKVLVEPQVGRQLRVEGGRHQSSLFHCHRFEFPAIFQARQHSHFFRGVDRQDARGADEDPRKRGFVRGVEEQRLLEALSLSPEMVPPRCDCETAELKLKTVVAERL